MLPCLNYSCFSYILRLLLTLDFTTTCVETAEDFECYALILCFKICGGFVHGILCCFFHLGFCFLTMTSSFWTVVTLQSRHVAYSALKPSLSHMPSFPECGCWDVCVLCCSAWHFLRCEFCHVERMLDVFLSPFPCSICPLILSWDLSSPSLSPPPNFFFLQKVWSHNFNDTEKCAKLASCGVYCK